MLLLRVVRKLFCYSPSVDELACDQNSYYDCPNPQWRTFKCHSYLSLVIIWCHSSNINCCTTIIQARMAQSGIHNCALCNRVGPDYVINMQEEDLPITVCSTCYLRTLNNKRVWRRTKKQGLNYTRSAPACCLFGWCSEWAPVLLFSEAPIMPVFYMPLVHF